MGWRRTVLVLVMVILVLPCAALGAETDSGSEEVIFQPVTEVEKGSVFEETVAFAGDEFGPRRRHFHPFLSVETYFTTNLFNIENEESEWVQSVAPGLWVSFPGSRQPLLRVETLNTAPGGLELSRFRERDNRRFRAYALYRGEFTEHENFSAAETDDHRAEALLRYNAPGGLSVELLDIYEDDHDDFSTGNAAARQLDTYSANLLSPAVGFRISPKLSFRLNYSWYDLEYDSDRRSFRDREDHAFSGYLFYRLSGKTTSFIDYEHVQVEYDNNSQRDNKENRYFAGLQWQVTEKSRGRLKLGYGKKEYDESGQDDERDSFMTEVQVDHRFTPKTSVSLKLLRRIHESDLQGVRNALVHRIKLGYRQKLTAKITAKADLFFHRVAYDGDITVGTQTDEREDDSYGAAIAAGYAFKRWLNISSGYLYSERDSNFDRDYRKHTVFLNLTVAL